MFFTLSSVDFSNNLLDLPWILFGEGGHDLAELRLVAFVAGVRAAVSQDLRCYSFIDIEK